MSEYINEFEVHEIASRISVQRSFNAVQQAIIFLKTLSMTQQQIAILLREAQPSISQFINGRRPGKQFMMRLYTIIEQDLPDRLAFQWQNYAREEVLKALEEAIIVR